MAELLLSIEDGEFITAVVGLVLVAVGLVSNVICAYSCQRPALAEQSTTNLIGGAALGDFIILVLRSFRFVDLLYDGVTEDELMHGGEAWRCRAVTFFEGMARLVSAWLLVSMVAEATLGAFYNRNWSMIYTNRRTSYITGHVYILSSVAVIIYVIIVKANKDKCASEYQVFFDIYKDAVLGLALSSVFPIVSIIICFIIIATVRLYQSRQDNSDDRKRENWRPDYVEVTMTCSSIFVIFTFPQMMIDFARILARYGALPKSSEWLITEQDGALMITVASVLYLVPFCTKFFICYAWEKSFRVAVSQIVSRFGIDTGQAGTVDYNDRRAILEEDGATTSQGCLSMLNHCL